MRNIFRYLSVILLSVAGIAASAQNASEKSVIKGQVLDANTRKPLSSVSVSSSSIRRAAVSDAEGRFSVTAYSKDIILMFARDGYYSTEVKTYGRDSLRILLQSASRTMTSATVVLPLGETSPANIAGQADNIHISRISEGQMAVSDALAGRMAGLRVLSKSGMPGEGSFVNFRGNRTIYADNTPLVVIDGIPYIIDENISSIVNGYSYDILEVVSPSNIENVTFIKGADAIQYGSLGSNGVLMIQTRRGRVSQTSVEFTSTEGAALNSKQIPLLSGMGFNRYIADVASGKYSSTESIGKDFPFLSGNMTYDQKVRYGFNTDWQDLIYKPAIHSNNVLKVSGGDAIVQYLVTAGYQYIDGTLYGTSKGKFNTTGNTSINFSEKLKAFAAISFDFIDIKEQEQGLSPETNPILSAFSYSPIMGVNEVDANGGILKEYNPVDPMMGISNPVSILENIEAKNKIYDFSVNLGVDYTIIPNLKADVRFGIFYKYIKDDIFIGGKSTSSIAALQDGIALNTVRSGASESKDYFVKAGLSYDLNKGRHSASFNAGYQLLSSGYSASRGMGINTATDRYKTLGDVSSTGRRTGGYDEAQRWINVYAGAKYNYNRILYASLAGQIDRSSSYGAHSHLWYPTPAAQLSWKINNMPLLRNVDAISDFNLRAEYSINTNSRYRNSLSSFYYVLKQIKDVSGLVRAGIPNEKLGPEKVSNFDFGLDFALAGDKLRLTADVFEQKTNDMIMASDIPGTYGFTTTYRNDGAMRTRGLEAGISAVLVDKGFHWRVGGNISWYKTVLTDLGASGDKIIDYGDGVTLINRKGEAPFSFYGFKTDGVYATTADAKASGLATNGGYQFQGGDVKFIDNGDHVISDKDKAILGSADPDFFGGFYSEMRIKGFRLYANFTYSYGNEIYNATRRYNESGSSFRNQAASVDRRWVAEGQVTDIPRAAYGDPAGNSRFSDRWIEDGSYLKLKELTFSWETRKKFLFMNGFKVYVTGENLFTVTKYTGIDPEFAYSYNMATVGMDLCKVPVPRIIKAGIVVKL
ncbi:MAG: SusC/RagA family TonB-linked outer membrane protein [Candidatus Cryptobacteroides sp.]